jgi:hypothetical protein
VDFSVAQSLAYQGKYGEAFANIKQSGVLDAVRKGGILAENEFSKIFGMGLDEFQARAEGGKSIGLKGTMDAENKSFLERVSNAELGFQIKAAEIRFDKAIVDAKFAQELAFQLNKDPEYRNAVTKLSDMQLAVSSMQSIMDGLLPSAGILGAYGGYRLIKGKVTPSTPTTPGGAKPTASGIPAGNNFAGYKMTGTGANAMLQRPDGKFASKAERAAFDKSVKMGKLAKMGKFAGKGLGILGAGLDAYGRYNEGQSTTQIAAGVGTAAAAGWAGAAYGAQLGAAGGPFAWATVPAGALIGGGLGYFLGGKAADAMTGVGQPAKKVEQAQQSQQVQESLDNTTQLLTVVKNIELLVAEMAGYQATPAVVQMIMDGKDISNSLVKHQLNSRGQKKETTLKQSLGWYR